MLKFALYETRKGYSLPPIKKFDFAEWKHYLENTILHWSWQYSERSNSKKEQAMLLIEVKKAKSELKQYSKVHKKLSSLFDSEFVSISEKMDSFEDWLQNDYLYGKVKGKKVPPPIAEHLLKACNAVKAKELSSRELLDYFGRGGYLEQYMIERKLEVDFHLPFLRIDLDQPSKSIKELRRNLSTRKTIK